jgi:hypothetical protein
VEVIVRDPAVDEVSIRILERRDPAWGRIDAAVFGEPPAAHPLPRTLEELGALRPVIESDVPTSSGVSDGWARLPLRALGRYLLVPYVHGAVQLQLIRAVEITEPGETVTATIGG